MHMQVKAVPKTAKGGSPRRTFFRTFRLLLAVALLGGIGFLGWRALTVVVSDQAYINAEIIPLRAPIAGALHMQNVEPGSVVDAGTPLLQIDNPQFANTPMASELNRMQETVERLRAECEEAEARLPKMEQIYQRAATMNREKLMSQVQFMEEEVKLTSAKASAVKRREQLGLAEKRHARLEKQATTLQSMTVNAPFDGVVWAAPARDGAFVQPHETALQLIDPKHVWVDAYLPERHAGKFRTGMPVTVRLLDDQRTLQGRVESVRAGVGRVPVGNSGAVAPGEFAQRRIAIRVKLETANPFPASEFYGVGRSVALELPKQ